MMTTRSTTRNNGRRRRAPSPAAARTAGLQVTEVPIGELRPWPGNPRRMPAEEMCKLRRSVEAFGMVQPLVVRRADGTVIGGHQRLEAAKAQGLTRVPVVYVELSEPEAKAFNLALNRISGEWDLPKLGQLLEELQASPDANELLSGFGANEIANITSVTAEGLLVEDLRRRAQEAQARRERLRAELVLAEDGGAVPQLDALPAAVQTYVDGLQGLLDRCQVEQVKAGLTCFVRRIYAYEDQAYSQGELKPVARLVFQGNLQGTIRLLQSKVKIVSSPGGIRTRDLMAENHAS